ncbi:hypothetical protein BS78_06G017700 [Paspalum vaginatum]|nr:hypothetical protein BS78_06G017700 [Paspalum vaginatum]
MLPPAKRQRLAPPLAAAPRIVPEDILLTEVLPRLPVRSLFRCRSVCRSWSAGIDDPLFARRHLQHQHLSHGARMSVLDVPCEPRLEEHWGEARSKEMEFRRIQLHGARHHQQGGGEPAAAATATTTTTAELMHSVVCPENRFTALLQPLLHCDGMVLVATASGELFVCNPATREFVELPPGSPTLMQWPGPGPVAFGFDPYTNTYKVARVFYRGFELVEDDEPYDDDGQERGTLDVDHGHEVFTLGSGGGGSWEPTEDPPHCIACATPICTRGAFYCSAAVGRADEPRPFDLLRFCMRDETFTVVPYPPCFSQSGGVIGDQDTLTELGGRLCCAHVRCPRAVDIWLASDDGGHGEEKSLQWSIAYRIELLKPVDHSVLPLDVYGDDEVLLSVDRRMLCKCNATTKAVKEVLDMERALDLYGATPQLSLRLLHNAVPYVESLMSISG